MTPTPRREWLIPAALVFLSLVPVGAGAFRVAELTGGGEVTAANERFFDSPVPVVLHILSVSTYSLLGAFQFAPGLRRRRPGWHRTAGRILIPSGILTALTGMWMTVFYDLPEMDGDVLNGIRLVVGSAMILFIILGFAAIRRRDITRHSAWMTRAYALGMGAGTQVFTLGTALLLGASDQFTKTALMAAGWAINIAVAEWVIHQRTAKPARKPRRAGGDAVLVEG